MTLNELIKELQKHQEKSGDWRLSTWDGFIEGISLDPCKDGIVNVDPAEFNELSLDIRTELS